MYNLQKCHSRYPLAPSHSLTNLIKGQWWLTMRFTLLQTPQDTEHMLTSPAIPQRFRGIRRRTASPLHKSIHRMYSGHKTNLSVLHLVAVPPKAMPSRTRTKGRSSWMRRQTIGCIEVVSNLKVLQFHLDLSSTIHYNNTTLIAKCPIVAAMWSGHGQWSPACKVPPRTLH